MRKTLTIEQFIQRSNKIHKNKFDYSLVEYYNAHTKITIICPNHGKFDQQPRSHLNGVGCSKCTSDVFRSKREKQFLQKAKKTNKNKYDYSLVEYKNKKTKVKIICKKHGIFYQNLLKHSQGKQGCKECLAESKRLTNKQFIQKAKRVHKNRYDYRFSVYEGCNKKVKIKCSRHGIFEQIPHNHLSGHGCWRCAWRVKNI